MEINCKVHHTLRKVSITHIRRASGKCLITHDDVNKDYLDLYFQISFRSSDNQIPIIVISFPIFADKIIIFMRMYVCTYILYNIQYIYYMQYIVPIYYILYSYIGIMWFCYKFIFVMIHNGSSRILKICKNYR